jgi:hypothetical protein
LKSSVSESRNSLGKQEDLKLPATIRGQLPPVLAGSADELLGEIKGLAEVDGGPLRRRGGVQLSFGERQFETAALGLVGFPVERLLIDVRIEEALATPL